MKQKCIKCQTIVEIDETAYSPGTKIPQECSVCGEQLEFVIPNHSEENPTPADNEKEHTKKDVKPKRPVQPKENTPTESLATTPSGNSKNRKPLIILGIAIFVIAALVTYINWYRPYAKDRDAERAYVIAEGLYIRSSQVVGVQYNILGEAPYGSELIVYQKGAEWSDVKWKSTLQNESFKGYAATSYMVSKEDFDLLHSIWGNDEARMTLKSSRFRFALIDYFRNNELFAGPDGWQFYSTGENSQVNYFYIANIYNPNSKYPDLFIVLKDNSNTNNYRLVAFSFDDETEKNIYRRSWDISSYGKTNYCIKRIQVDPENPYYLKIMFADGDISYRYL